MEKKKKIQFASMMYLVTQRDLQLSTKKAKQFSEKY